MMMMAKSIILPFIAVLTWIPALALAKPNSAQFELKEEDVAKIEMTIEFKKSAELTLTLRDETQASFAVFSETNLDQKVDLIVDGEVVASPMMTGPISGPKITVTCRQPREALRIARSLVPDSTGQRK